MSGMSFQEHRLQFPVCVVVLQCNWQVHYLEISEYYCSGYRTAIINSNYYMSPPSSTTFTIDGSRIGQKIELENEKNNKGGFRPIVISPRPIPIGTIFKATSGLDVSYSISNDLRNVAQIKGVGSKAMLVLGGKNGSFSGFENGKSELTFKITASQSGNDGTDGNPAYHAAADIVREFTIKKPNKNSYFTERKSDFRFDTKKTQFRQRFLNISEEKADYKFNSDAYDSDGDGLTNLEERLWR